MPDDLAKFLIGLAIVVVISWVHWPIRAWRERRRSREEVEMFCPCVRWFPGYCDSDCPGPRPPGYDPRNH